MPSDVPQFQIGNVGADAIVQQGGGNVIGFTAAQVEKLIKAEREGLVQQYTSELVALSVRLGTTETAVRMMLRLTGETEDIPVERFPERLMAVATQYLAMRQGAE
jgi:hypothetical protein